MSGGHERSSASSTCYSDEPERVRQRMSRLTLVEECAATTRSSDDSDDDDDDEEQVPPEEYENRIGRELEPAVIYEAFCRDMQEYTLQEYAGTHSKYARHPCVWTNDLQYTLGRTCVECEWEPFPEHPYYLVFPKNIFAWHM